MAERRVFIIQPTAQRRPQINPNIAASFLMFSPDRLKEIATFILKDNPLEGARKGLDCHQSRQVNLW